MPREYKFCPQCAAPFGRKHINDIERLACTGCGFIFWQNPVVGVAVAVLDADSVILGRRSRGIYAGQWCIPCGYVEYDEDVREAARREFAEETGLLVKLGDVLTVHSNFHNPAMHSVGIWFRGTVEGGEMQADDDLDDVAYHSLRKPFPALAFPTDELVLAQLKRELG
jgi:ADP-ribose pyrophosphatase YjhB (NUDIX family)